MSGDLMNTVTNNISKMSRGQRLIARYIIENYDKAAFMTASRLGQAVGVSESTVVRFAAEIGYDGYPKLQKALQELVRTKLTSVQRIAMTGNQLGDGDLIGKVLTMDIDKIRRTVAELDRAEFFNAADAIMNARTIYILGIRSSSSLASFLAFYLNHIFPDVRLVNSASTSDVFEQMIHIGNRDIFIAISFPRYSKRTLLALKFVKERSVKAIAITDTSLSPIAALADYKLYARSDMASFVDSLVAPLSLINALIVAIGMKNYANASNCYEELEKIWDKYDVYTKDDEIGNKHDGL
jgi:DNA-binding MurR/RpiR family transcriptional regulator